MNRKELKQAGKRSFHRHYLLLMFLGIIMAFFGTEAVQSTALLEIKDYTSLAKDANPSILGINDVYTQLATGNFELGEAISERLHTQFTETDTDNTALGRRNGVLASVVNSVASGKLFVVIAGGLFSMTKSKTAAGVLLILITVLIIAAVWILLMNLYSAMMRRMFLEARTYEKTPFLDVFHFGRVRQWFRAAWTMFMMRFFNFLWSLTIVGFFIKHYSYYAVPFIVAENPSVKGFEALTLSRKMMNGHKWEAFVYDLSFIGWYVLSVFTVGLSDAFYGFSYRTACRTEYYAYLRGLAKEQGIPGSELMNDTYLYEIGDKITLYETYFDVVDQQTILLENEMKLTGVRAKINKWLSIWLWKFSEKKKFDELEGIRLQVERKIASRDGKVYPLRLSPLWQEAKFKLNIPFTYTRSYTVWTVILLFFLFCFVGWAWEMLFYIVNDGVVVNRGMLHGPWLPVYGTGGLIALLICSRFRKTPVLELIVSVVLCGTIEYLAAVMLENAYHQRWWSYDGYFLNINGRVCAEGLIVFGIACMLVVYLIAPFFDFLICKVNEKIVRAVAIILLVIFMIDLVYSSQHPNTTPGAVVTDDNKVPTAAAEEILSGLPGSVQFRA